LSSETTPPGKSPAKAGVKDDPATVKTDDHGQPILCINVPWRGLANPSIQAALILDPAVDPKTLNPLVIDGQQAVATWKSQAAALNKPAFAEARQVVRTMKDLLETGDQKLLSIFGRNNALGRPASCAVDDDGLRLAFYLLDAWSDQKGAVHVELSDLHWPPKANMAPKFDAPGRLVVWLLDDNKVVWSKVLEWPGKAVDKPQPPAPQPAGGIPGGRTTNVERANDPANLSGRPQPPSQASGGGTVMSGSTVSGSTGGSGTTGTASSPGTTATSVRSGQQPAAGGGGWQPRGAASAPAAVNNSVANGPPARTASAPDGPLTVEQMSVDQLAEYIERTYGKRMTPAVRQSWEQGWYLYYKVQNSDDIRRSQFMTTLRTCWRDQPSGELRDAIAILFLKLKKLQLTSP